MVKNQSIIRQKSRLISLCKRHKMVGFHCQIIAIMSRFSAVIDSYLRCVEDERFFEQFYSLFLQSDPFVRQMFARVDFKQQHTLIRRGLMSILTYLDDGNLAGKVTLRRLKETHGGQGMHIQSKHYKLWKDALLKTIEIIDPQYDEALGKLWTEALEHGIMLMISDESSPRPTPGPSRILADQ